MLTTPFTRHPASVGENYVKHLRAALSFAILMLAGACACIVHAVLPFTFERTGSRIIASLHDRMIANRRRSGPDSAIHPARSALRRLGDALEVGGVLVGGAPFACARTSGAD